nr:2Fe-2S iron-sulfur cluster binding domain-containing protein [Halogeometricum pallidum]
MATDDGPDIWTVTITIPKDVDRDDAGRTFEIEVSADETILAAARREGVWLPADCQQGWCTTCAGRVVDGEVTHPHARRYHDEDREAGFALLCTARPRSDVTVVTDQYDELLAFRAKHDRPPGNAKFNDD